MPRRAFMRELVRFQDKRAASESRDILSEAGSKIRGIAFYIDGTLAVETNAMSFAVPVGLSLTIASVTAKVDTAPTGATLIIDINKNGTTIFTTQANRPTIAISGTTVTSAAPDVTSLTGGDKVTLEIDQVGSTVAGENLAVTINCTEA